MKKIFGFILLISSLSILFYSILKNNNFVLAHGDNENDTRCGSDTYYFEEDDRNWKVLINFKNNRKEIDIKGLNGWKVVKVELDVEDDNHTGFWKYSEGDLLSFNPHPGGKIKEARVTVNKKCFTPTPTSTDCSTPTNIPTFTPSHSPISTPTMAPTLIPTQTATPTFTPIPTLDPCENGCTAEPTATPSSSPTQTPTPTIVDMCLNIDGLQSVLPEGKHFDSTGVNCVEYSKPETHDNSSNNNSVVSTVQTAPQVLGVSTMANTGALEDSLFYNLFSIGSLLTSIGIMKNGQKKKS